jgi:hypothetical protein
MRRYFYTGSPNNALTFFLNIREQTGLPAPKLGILYKQGKLAEARELVTNVI